MVPEIKKITDTASSIASFFHRSGVRTKELRKIAEDKNLTLVKLPETYEVRWTQFTHQLINAILKSWHALVVFFQQSIEAESRGFLNFLIDKDNLELLSFLADVLEIFSQGQKNIQKDSNSLIDMIRYVKSMNEQLQSLLSTPLLGGWVSALKDGIIIKYKEGEPEEYRLKEILLKVNFRRVQTHNLYVSVRRNTSAIKNEIIQSLNNKLKQRFDEDEEKMIDSLEKFSKFVPSVNLEKIHQCIGSDLQLSTLHIQFSEIINIGLNEKLKDLSITQKIKELLKTNSYDVVITVLARIAAAKPHSADVERLISCNNILKTSHRCSMDIKTENLYLYVYFNMPCLKEWDPRPAIVRWLESKERRNKSVLKAKDQRWFSGIFYKHEEKELEEGQVNQGCQEKKKPTSKKNFF